MKSRKERGYTKMKKGNFINFKKRIVGMLAMVLAMFMLMGNTAMAANYYTHDSHLKSAQGEFGPTVSYGTVLQAGDTITCDYRVESSGYVSDDTAGIFVVEDTGGGYPEVKIDETITYGASYTLEDGYSYEYFSIVPSPRYFVFLRTALPTSPSDPGNGGGAVEQQPPTGMVDPTPMPQPEPTHSHDYEVNRKEATEIEDGWIKLQCKYCGHVKEEGPLSAMSEFWMNSVDKVNKATPGDNVVLESKIWYSMPDYVMEAIAGRRDITVTMKMKYEHKNYEIVISPEETVQYTDKYYGVLYLCQLYGGNIVE